MKKKHFVVSVGNLYLETNFLGVETNHKAFLEFGKEYSAPKYGIQLGGSAVNFATQIKKYDVDVALLGKVGKDETGTALLKILSENQIVTDLIKQSDSVQTNIDNGFVMAGTARNIQLVAGDANQSLSLDDLDLDNKLFNEVSAIYFGGSFKQKHLWPHYPKVFEKLSKRGISCFIDPNRIPVDATPGWINIVQKVLPFTNCYFLNDQEIVEVTGSKNIDYSLNKVLSWGAKMIVLKMGPNGCIIKTKEKHLVIPGFKVKAVNTVGAGDCFNASFIKQLLDKKDLYFAGLFANAAASLKVENNLQPTEEDVLFRLRESGIKG